MQKKCEILYVSIYCDKINKGVKIPFKDVVIWQKRYDTDIDRFTTTTFDINCKCGERHEIKKYE